MLRCYASDVGQQRQQREKGAQHVLAFGNPGDGFHVQRMPREQRGDKRGRPQFPREPEQQEEKQNRIHRVKQDVDGMVRPGVEAEQHSQSSMCESHVTGCQLPRVSGGEGPFDSSPRQAVLDDAIFRDVIVVVVIHKAVARHRQVSQQRDEREQQSP